MPNKTILNFKNTNHLNVIIWLLRLSTFFVFFGRGLEHLFFDAPFRSVLWDPDIMSSFITNFTSYSWTDYVTSPTVDLSIKILTKITGAFYIFCSIATLVLKPKNINIGKLLIVGAVLLTILSTLFYKEKFLKFGQFIEYSCQMFSPLFLYLMLYVNINQKKITLLLKIAIALTFFGHGLYALGVYITPGYWTDMAMSSLRFIGLYFSESEVNKIIYYAGIIDMAIVVGVFLPKKITYPFLIWAAIWGLLTALSRVVGYTNIYPNWSTFTQFLPQTIYRLPHFFIPLAAFLLSFSHRKNTIQKAV